MCVCPCPCPCVSVCARPRWLRGVSLLSGLIVVRLLLRLRASPRPVCDGAPHPPLSAPRVGRKQPGQSGPPATASNGRIGPALASALKRISHWALSWGGAAGVGGEMRGISCPPGPPGPLPSIVASPSCQGGRDAPVVSCRTVNAYARFSRFRRAWSAWSSSHLLPAKEGRCDAYAPHYRGPLPRVVTSPPRQGVVCLVLLVLYPV